MLRNSSAESTLLRNAVAPARARFLEPMLCLAVREIPTGPEWAYEIKLDGYRALGLKTAGRVALGSRNGKDFTRRYAGVSAALDALPDETLIDGELVAIDGDGMPSFKLLQDFDSSCARIVFYAFDLPFLGGLGLRQQTLDTRRGMLHELIATVQSDGGNGANNAPIPISPIRYSETFDVPAADLIAIVREKQLEGVIAKRRDSIYHPGKRTGE